MHKRLIKISALGVLIALVLSFGVTISADDSVVCSVEVRSRLWELLVGGEEDAAADERVYLIPGGQVFGTRINQAHPSVIDKGECDALECGDVILYIDKKEVSCLDDVKAALVSSRGKVRVTIERKGKEVEMDILLHEVGGEYRLGCTLRDGAAGIGTVTYINPATGEFGGLGHGIYDESGDHPIEITGGTVTGVILGNIEKGESGKPGELTGMLTDKELGVITMNTDVGVFGKFNRTDTEKEAMPVAHRSEVKEGAATILSTLRNGKKLEYDIEIYDVDHSSTGTKSFKIHVSDVALLAISGGIVRGMSGSPVIQDGKLVGAVTHVMVASPTEGYGIFIENMLSAAENTVPKAA